MDGGVTKPRTGPAGKQIEVVAGHAVVASPKVSTLSVFGLGYIGLPTSLAFAHAGHRVIGVDVDAEAVNALNAGRLHIFEEGLEEYYRAARETSLFHATLEPVAADAYLIAVPTPVSPDHSADLSYVEAASKSIGAVIRRGDLVVLESTVPPRTCLDVVGPAIEAVSGLKHGLDYDLAHCPERVIPGRILIELFENDRIIGGTTPGAARRAAELYRSFVIGDIFETDTTTAETIKLMENTFRDVNIALANELKAVCDSVGADPVEAIRLANRHPRVDIHQPGIGVGGHCIPVDPWFLVEAAPDVARLIATARGINDARPREVVDSLLRIAGERKPRKVALLGLAYKPDVDDFRESPAVEIAARFAQAFDGQVEVVDPYTDSLPGSLGDHPNVRLVAFEEALESADMIVGLVGHTLFVEARVPETCPRAIVLDLAGVWR